MQPSVILLHRSFFATDKMFRREAFSKQVVVLLIVFVTLTVFVWNLNGGYKRGLKSFLTLRNQTTRQSQYLNIFAPESVPDNFTRAKLTYSRGKAVCFVHGTFDYVSNAIMTTGGWETGHIAEIEHVFNLDPSLGLIDLGCNVGVYTIVAAMRQRKVVSVDMNIANLKRVRKSLLENKVAQNVKLIYNGISNR